MAGTSKRIRVANRRDADLFLAKDFLELGGTQNALSYKNPDYLNMTGEFDQGPAGVPRKSFASTTQPPGSNVDILVCTNPWSNDSVTPSGQIRSYTYPGPAVAGLLDEDSSTFYNSQIADFIVLTTGVEGDAVGCPQLTWWWSSMIVLDRFGLVNNSNYTTQYGFYDALTSDISVDQDATACEWRPGNLNDFNLSSFGSSPTINAIPGSCTNPLPAGLGNLSLPGFG